MAALSFHEIAKLPVITHYEDAFRRATGVPLVVLPPQEQAKRFKLGSSENAFCTLASTTTVGCEECWQTQTKAQTSAAQLTGAKQIHCYAGLTDVAVPVILKGKHLATLMSGQVFRRAPTERDFEIVVKYIGQGRDAVWVGKLRETYFGTPVVNAERFEAIIQLLNVFAQYLADYVDSHAIAFSPEDPASISKAKRYILDHIDEPIDLGRLVGHVGISRFYFCKLFKKATGMTLTNYVIKARLERAKVLLGDPSLRISEVVFASGFGSIPRFNSVFKRHVGVAPTAYRESLRTAALG